jgi:hypothetical protein
MPLATHGDAILEYARNVGRDHPDRAWILTDYDTWEQNPFYNGAKVRHPEDDQWEQETEDDDCVGPNVNPDGTRDQRYA